MTFVVTGAVLDCPQVREQHYQTTQLQKAALSERAPWLYSALAQLRELETSGAVVAGLGDLRIPERVAYQTRLVLALIPQRDLPIPVVSPVSGGGVSITWQMGNKEVKFSALPDGQVLFFNVFDDEVLSDGTLDLGRVASVEEPLRWIATAG